MAMSLLSLLAAVAVPLSAASECSHAIVGGGPGGVYTAWRLATSLPNASICLFERHQRLGGRIASVRGLGPKKDLVVEAGAYRFVPVPECNEFGPPGQRVTKCEWTPLTAHLVKDALKLKTKLYDPFPGDHSKMEKIVDASGHNAGYGTFVELMAQQAEDLKRLKIFLGHEVVGLRRSERDTSGGVVLSVKGPNKTFEVGASAVLLNIPQLLLLRLLRASSQVDEVMSPPADLFAPSSYAILKLYVHYQDAWWRNYLQLTGGEFSNMMGSFSAWEAPYQFPLPLEGRYWDGDFRCDGADAERPCRGFLEAIYGGDDAIIESFRPFMLADRNGDPIVVLDQQKDKELLKRIHRSLVAFHEKPLRKAGKLELVNASLPDSAVLSSWTAEAAGFEAGCHNLKVVSPRGYDMEDIKPVFNSSLQRSKFVRPLGHDVRVFLADEAFGWPSCWAESSLVLAENAVHEMEGLAKPSWLPEEVYHYIMFKDHEASTIGPKAPSCGGDPFLRHMQGTRHPSQGQELVV